MDNLLYVQKIEQMLGIFFFILKLLIPRNIDKTEHFTSTEGC